MKKPRKPFTRIIRKSRKITEPTVISPTVQIKPCAPAYADGLEPEITVKPSRVRLKDYMRSWRYDV